MLWKKQADTIPEMNRQYHSRSLWVWAAIALIWLTLALRLGLAVIEQPELPAWQAVLGSFSYFTVLTTLLAALALSATRVVPWSPLARLGAPGFMGLVVVSLVLVALVYTLVLRSQWQPEGLRRFVDILLHDVIPVLVCVYWWLYTAKVGLRYRWVGVWLLYPLIYLAGVLALSFTGADYPYPFLDAGELGFGRVALNAMGLLGLYAGLATGLVALSRWRYRSTTKA
ncbi:Pr6Pr family membrane protein [Marinimicrobium alkaliphilum]|uniref:Pr6Pr family membrane protein n=1 Tax=Marinimicrobium alkaliphilum TaxID=2202654 RepID=UPI0013005532|nr:Pr6Pr family membrane protein [Marinimicrobium alkaliphilum]